MSLSLTNTLKVKRAMMLNLSQSRKSTQIPTRTDAPGKLAKEAVPPSRVLERPS